MYLANQAKNTLRPREQETTPSPKRKRVVLEFVQKVEKIPKISYSTAIKMCEELTKYCKENNIWSVEIESSFETIKSEASKKKENTTKQRSINQFFKTKFQEILVRPTVSTSNVSSISIVKRNLNF